MFVDRLKRNTLQTSVIEAVVCLRFLQETMYKVMTKILYKLVTQVDEILLSTCYRKLPSSDLPSQT